jgi:hypothetical protein
VSSLYSKLKRDKKSGERFSDGVRKGSALDVRIQLGEESIEILSDVEEIEIDD